MKEKKGKRLPIRYGVILQVLRDIVIGAVSYVFAMLIGNNGAEIVWSSQLVLALTAVSTTILALFIVNCYRVVWRYAGIMEMVNLVAAYLINFVILVVVQAAANLKVSFAVITLYVYINLSISTVVRFSRSMLMAIARKFGDRRYAPPENIIIYGAGFTGSALVKRFIGNPDEGYNPVAILDDDPAKLRQVISGVRVVGGREQIHHAMREYKATTIAIAITKINREELRQIYSECVKHNATVKIVNDIQGAENALHSDAVSLKSINIEDLLRRPEHKVDVELLHSLLMDKVVMVTGGAGSIGSEICRQALQYGCKHLVIYDHFENGMFELNEEFVRKFESSRYSLVIGSVKDRDKLRLTMERFKPEVVLHAAAYKHVPMMEINGDEAVKNNVFGTRNVIDQCEESGVGKFILISTDKAVNPANIMGATKRMAELLVEAKAQKTKGTVYSAVRFGNVLGSSGSVIPTFIRQINHGGPVTVTHREMKRYFMSIPEAVRLVMQAGALATGGEVFVLDMGEPVYIYDLACDIIKLSGMVPNKDIRIEITGLRPGEKLFEELRFNNEDVDKTTHDGIFICKLEPVNATELNATLNKLRSAADDRDRQTVEKVLFEMVPDTYRNL